MSALCPWIEPVRLPSRRRTGCFIRSIWVFLAASRFAAKLRAAFGNDGKAPTLYQRFSEYGAPNLLPQSNVGGEVGIDQKLFNDRLTFVSDGLRRFL